MMFQKITFIFVILLFALFAVNASAQNTASYGKGVTTDQFSEISDIVTKPDNYLGKLVKVKGMVIEVCSKRGCWVNVADEKSGEQIQVKVTDGEIVFPMEATGKMGVFEGIVDEVKLSREQLIAYQKHLAEEKGVAFDPASVPEGTRYIRLVGLGAEIER